MSLNWNGKKPVVDCSKDKGFTVQADREDADINVIVSRFEKGMSINRLAAREPFFGDVSDLGDLQESLIKVQKANELFMGFDAQVRERFENDPVKFVEFFEDPKNLEEAVALGLAKPRPEPPAPTPPPSVPEPKG